jgi:hypothetical protein
VKALFTSPRRKLICLKQNLVVSWGLRIQHQLHVERSLILVELPMSNSSVKVKVAIALFMVLTTPAGSFARGGGGRGGGAAAMGGSRPNAALGAQIGTAGMLANPSRVGNVPR